MAELKANPPRLLLEHRARLESMSEEDIEHIARTDVDHPPMTAAQLDRAVFARTVRQLWEAVGPTQDDFAKRYRITLSRLRDWEQGRYRPDSVATAYVSLIRHDPQGVARALESEI